MAERELDEDGKDEDGIFRSHEPIYDRVGVRCINFLLLFMYGVLAIAGIAGIVLPPIFPNLGWPIMITFFIDIGITVLHFLVMGLGKGLVPGYLLYPIQPKWLYQIVDGIMFFMLIGVIASYILASLSPIVPMLGAWVLTVAMLINFHKVWRITYDGPADPPPVKFVDPPGTAWRKFRDGLEESGF